MKEREREKQKLIHLGADALAELVLDMGYKDEMDYQKIQRAISEPSKNVKRFKQRLNDIKKSEEIYWSDEADSLAEELSDLLQDIKQGASTPEERIGLISDFFESDEFIFEMADDSDGDIGDVYTSEALDLFVTFAKKCKNKQNIIETVVKLIINDQYGVRDCLIDECHQFLNLKELKALFDVVSKRYDKKDYGRKFILKSLAKQMKEGSLFEKITYESSDKEVSGSSLVEVAEVYFEAGNFKKAQSLIDQFSDSDKNTFGFDKKIDLQKRLFKAGNKRTELEKFLMKEFKRNYSEFSLKELLEVVGIDKKQALCSQAIDDILRNKGWDSSLAMFLIDCCEAFDVAEKYLLKHVTSLNGDLYFPLLPIAEKMEAQKKYLVASLIYRALLDSILGRGQPMSYHHGVKYLKKLDHLKNSIENWFHFLPHFQYYSGIQEKHGRKRSFWSQYRK